MLEVSMFTIPVGYNKSVTEIGLVIKFQTFNISDIKVKFCNSEGKNKKPSRFVHTTAIHYWAMINLKNLERYVYTIS